MKKGQPIICTLLKHFRWIKNSEDRNLLVNSKGHFAGQSAREQCKLAKLKLLL